jgi:hypothetical protein
MAVPDATAGHGDAVALPLTPYRFSWRPIGTTQTFE